MSLSAVIVITERAAIRLKGLLDGRVERFVRLGVSKRGCTGLSYYLGYENFACKYDEVVTAVSSCGSNVKVLIGPKDIMYVLGTHMDFVSDRVKSEFIFKNPKATETCGCGESFHM
jgi:iron-sulfur cluster assembly accessory protein